MDITGKAAIVTGASAGIGRATALALARAGARGIMLADIDAAGLAETARLVEAEGAEALLLPTDVTRIADLERLYADTQRGFGGIDIVVNNAGIVSGPPPFPETPLERIALVIAIDLTAVPTPLRCRLCRCQGGRAASRHLLRGVWREPRRPG
jgi:NAD(P)-dependent dehydrogenase (short-subunit alcohol dehydrogenase family)